MYENQYAGAYDSKLPRMGAYGRHTLYSGTQHVEQSRRPLRRHPVLLRQTLCHCISPSPSNRDLPALHTSTQSRSNTSHHPCDRGGSTKHRSQHQHGRGRRLEHARQSHSRYSSHSAALYLCSSLFTRLIHATFARCVVTSTRRYVSLRMVRQSRLCACASQRCQETQCASGEVTRRRFRTRCKHLDSSHLEHRSHLRSPNDSRRVEARLNN